MMGSTIPVVERFHSLQGEGAHMGRSAFFIRLAGCTVGCPWCDTKKSWTVHNHPQLNIQELSEEVVKARAKGAGFVVITGGEPLHHNLDPLCNAIRAKTTCQRGHAMPIHLETSGVDVITGSPNWITISPKRHALPRQELLAACHEIKVIISEEEDLMFAETMAQESINAKNAFLKDKQFKKNSIPKALLFLQPLWQSSEGQQLAINYVKKHPQWRLSMQTHKWLNLP